MKKINKILTFIVVFTLCVICGFKKTDVNAASAALTGPGTVRAGDTITLNLNISSPGSYGFEGSLAYDGSVSLVSMSAGTGGWKLEQNGSRVVVYDDALSNPLGNNSTVIKAVFKVNNVATGTGINISFNNIVVSDGNNESSIGTAKYSVAVAAPLSGNNNLGSLSIAGHNINFNASQTSYDIGTVEFSESSLNISAAPADATVIYVPFETKTISATGTLQDEKGKQVLNGLVETLKQGENKMTVTGVAEDDSKKVYNINVVVMPEYKGKLPSISGVETVTEAETETVEETESTTESVSATETDEAASENTKKSGIPVAVLIITAFVMLAAGYGICYALMTRGNKKSI